MTPPKTTLNYSIPSNKFYPPHICDTLALFRDELIIKRLPPKNNPNKVLTIEAQAGQGKTTLAYQYIIHHDYANIWYQIGREDADPVLLFTALFSVFTRKIKNFQSAELTSILSEGEIGPLDLKRCVNLLLHDLDQVLNKDLYIIFDDLHIIETATLSNNLISYLLDTSPPRLRFILTSRQPITLNCKALRNRTGSSHLTTTDLALNVEEIGYLFNNIYNRSINVREAESIKSQTNGWVMGIILIAHPQREKHYLRDGDDKLPSFNSQLTHSNMLNYFQEEIFAHIPQRLHKAFLQLSFLSEIRAELATLITSVSDIGKVLSEFTHENLFIYNLDEINQVFRFHHLYQDFLQQRARKELTEIEIRTIHETAASYYLDHQMVPEALTYYCQGKNHQKMDQIFQRDGMRLLGQNRAITLLTLLRSIPEDTLVQYGWLTLFAGILAMDSSPETTLPHFISAMTHFDAHDDEIGELISIAQIIYFHFVISGRYNTGAQLLPRAEELFNKNNDLLTVHAKIWISRNIAAGFCFFTSQMNKAKEFSQLAKELATKNNIHNFIASTRFILGYLALLGGNRTHFQQEAEISYSLLYNPLVGMSNKLTLRIMHLGDLSMHGDFLNFFNQQHLLQTSIDQKIVQQTIAAPYLYVWGCSCLIAMGKSEQGLELINKGFEISGTARTEHMQSQLLQWQSYASAILGDEKTAITAINKSITLRAVSGGPFYQAFNHIIAGAVFIRMKNFQQAEDHLQKGLYLAEATPSTYLQACAHLNLSHCHILSGNKENAHLTLRRGLEVMRHNNYKYFWTWEPLAMKELLSYGIEHDIEKDFCKTLASERLQINFTDKAMALPQLQFNLLDSFNVQLNGKSILHVDDFTRLQRELLGLLLVTKGHRISQEKLQLIFWPDSPPTKARKKFDSLLRRLRDCFSDIVNIPMTKYIVLQKGIVSLQNIQTDTHQFNDIGNKALSHYKSGELWQAGNYFYSALSLWKGNLPTNTFNSDQVHTFEAILLETFTNISLTWGKILAKNGQMDEARTVIESLLQTNGLEEKGIALLCYLYTQTNQPLKLKATLERYKNELQRIDYTPSEIKGILNDIKASLDGQKPLPDTTRL